MFIMIILTTDINTQIVSWQVNAMLLVAVITWDVTVGNMWDSTINHINPVLRSNIHTIRTHYT
jgi:hypothetical protein